MPFLWRGLRSRLEVSDEGVVYRGYWRDTSAPLDEVKAVVTDPEAVPFYGMGTTHIGDCGISVVLRDKRSIKCRGLYGTKGHLKRMQALRREIDSAIRAAASRAP